MADEQDQVYALDAGGNKIATLTTAQILEAIAEAIETGQVPSELKAFIDAVQEQNKAKSLKFWLGTQAEFLALESTSDDIIYFINDSTNLRDLANALERLKEQLQSGDFVVKKAEEAEEADDATNVTANINGKAISSIFESDGTTVKEATNVKTSINGKAISSIFESDGTTVKNATKAEEDEDGNNIKATYAKKTDIPENVTDAENVTETINGKAISSIFESNGTTVKNATIAQYASSDTSKGTIEQRLTSLGFKKGSLNDFLPSYVTASAYTFASVTSEAAIIKQGKLATLIGTFTVKDGTSLIDKREFAVVQLTGDFIPEYDYDYDWNSNGAFAYIHGEDSNGNTILCRANIQRLDSQYWIIVRAVEDVTIKKAYFNGVYDDKGIIMSNFIYQTNH